MQELKDCNVQLKKEDWKINKKYFVRRASLMGGISSGLSSSLGINDSSQHSFVECFTDDSLSEPENISEPGVNNIKTEELQPVEKIMMENNKRERKISKSKVAHKQTLQKKSADNVGGGEIPNMLNLNESEPVKDAAIARIVRRSSRITPTKKNADGSCTEEQKCSSTNSISAVCNKIQDVTKKLFATDKVKANNNDKYAIRSSHDKLENVEVPQIKKKRLSRNSSGSSQEKKESPNELSVPEVLDNPKPKRKYIKKKGVQEEEKKRESSKEKLEVEIPGLKKSLRRYSSAETSSNSNSITNGNEIPPSEKAGHQEKIIPEIEKNEHPCKREKKSKLHISKKSKSTLRKGSSSHVSNVQQSLLNKEVKGKLKDKTAKKKYFIVKNSDDIVRCIKYFEFTDEQKTMILNHWQLSAKNQKINETTGQLSIEKQINYTGCENGTAHGKDVLYIARIDKDSLKVNGNISTGVFEQKLDDQHNDMLNANKYELKVIHNEISIVPADSSQLAEEPDSKKDANSSLEDFLSTNFRTSTENEWTDADILESRIYKNNSLFADDFEPTVDYQPEITNEKNVEMTSENVQSETLFDSLLRTNSGRDNVWPQLDFQSMLSEEPIISENILDSCPLSDFEYIPRSATRNECPWEANTPKRSREPSEDLEISANVAGHNSLQNICEAPNTPKQVSEEMEDMEGTTIERAENQKTPMTGSYIISETNIRKPVFIDCLHSSTPVHGISVSRKENSVQNALKCYDPSTIQGCNLGVGNLSRAFNNISNIEKLKPNDKLVNVSSFDKSTSKDKYQDHTIVDVDIRKDKPCNRKSFEKNSSKDISQNTSNFGKKSSIDKSQNISSLEKSPLNDKSQKKSKFEKTSSKDKTPSISKLENSPIDQSLNNSKSEKSSQRDQSQNVFKSEKSILKDKSQNTFDFELNKSKEKCMLKEKSQRSPNVEKIVKDSSQKINLKEKKYIKSNRDSTHSRRHVTATTSVSKFRSQNRYEIRNSTRNITVDVEDCLKNENVNETQESNRKSEKLDSTEKSNVETISKVISNPSIEMKKGVAEKNAQICKNGHLNKNQKLSDETSKVMAESSLSKNNIKADAFSQKYKQTFKNYNIPKLKKTEDIMSNTSTELILQNDIKANQTTYELTKKANIKLKDSPDLVPLRPNDFNLCIEKIIPEDDSSEEMQLPATSEIKNSLFKQPELSNSRTIEQELALLMSDDYDDGFKFETCNEELKHKEIVLETNFFNSSLNKSVEESSSPPASKMAPESCDIVKFGNSETHSLFDQYFHRKTPKYEIEGLDELASLCDKGTRHLDVTQDYNSDNNSESEESDLLSISTSSIAMSENEENGNDMSDIETNSQQSGMSLANFMNKELKGENKAIKNRIVFDLNQSEDNVDDKKEQAFKDTNGNKELHTSKERTENSSLNYEAAEAKKNSDYRQTYSRPFSVQAPPNLHKKILFPIPNSSTKFENANNTRLSLPRDGVPQNSNPNPIAMQNTNPDAIIPPSALDSFNLQLMMQTMPPPPVRNGMHQRRSGPILPECDPEFLENMRLVEEKPPPDLFVTVRPPHFTMRNFNNGYPQPQRRYNNRSNNNNSNWRGSLNRHHNRHQEHRPHIRPHLNRPRFEYQGNSRPWNNHNPY